MVLFVVLLAIFWEIKNIHQQDNIALIKKMIRLQNLVEGFS